MSPYQISGKITNIYQWCEEYLSFTRRLNAMIKEEDIDQLEPVLNTRQDLLEMLPDIMKNDNVPEGSQLLLDYICDIKELEKSSIRLLKSREREILQRACDIRRCRNNQLCRARKKTVPQYIDRLS